LRLEKPPIALAKIELILNDMLFQNNVSRTGMTAGLGRLKLAIEKVLTEPSYRDNARKLSEAIERAGGVKYAADIVDRVLQTNSPALNNDR
jgi:hypothetical protein